jgi:hypothetical protein
MGSEPKFGTETVFEQKRLPRYRVVQIRMIDGLHTTIIQWQGLSSLKNPLA